MTMESPAEMFISLPTSFCTGFMVGSVSRDANSVNQRPAFAGDGARATRGYNMEHG
jgi:hypothetical protein